VDFGDGGNEFRNHAGQVKFWRRRVRYLDIGMFYLVGSKCHPLSDPLGENPNPVPLTLLTSQNGLLQNLYHNESGLTCEGLTPSHSLGLVFPSISHSGVPRPFAYGHS